jgi:hypothetical protein
MGGARFSAVRLVVEAGTLVVSLGGRQRPGQRHPSGVVTGSGGPLADKETANGARSVADVGERRCHAPLFSRFDRVSIRPREKDVFACEALLLRVRSPCIQWVAWLSSNRHPAEFRRFRRYGTPSDDLVTMAAAMAEPSDAGPPCPVPLSIRRRSGRHLQRDDQFRAVECGDSDPCPASASGGLRRGRYPADPESTGDGAQRVRVRAAPGCSRGQYGAALLF